MPPFTVVKNSTTKAERYSELDKVLKSRDRKKLLDLINGALQSQYDAIDIDKILRGVDLDDLDEIERRIQAQVEPLNESLDYDETLALFILFALLGRDDGFSQAPRPATGSENAEINADVRQYAQARLNSLLGVNPDGAQITGRIDSPYLENGLDVATVASILMLVKRAINQAKQDGVIRKGEIAERYRGFVEGEVARRAELITDDNAATMYGAALFLAVSKFGPVAKTWLRTESLVPREIHLNQVGVTVPYNSTFPSGDFWSQELINCKCGILVTFSDGSQARYR
jgi:hypothetical protein